MLDHNELKRGVQFILEGEPHVVLDSSFTYKGRGSSTVQAKTKSLKSGTIVTRTFHSGDSLEEAELEKRALKFVYENRGTYVFAEEANPGNRFEFTAEQLGQQMQFLAPDVVVEGLVFENEIINIALPVKMSFNVTEAPPGIKGDRSQGGTKAVTLETGVILQAPLFIEAGDTIEINTETGEYVRRVEKG